MPRLGDPETDRLPATIQRMPDGQENTRSSGSRTQTLIRSAGHGVGKAMLRAPWLWPVMRGPVRRFFDLRAESWDARTVESDPGFLLPMATALTHVREPEKALDLGTGTGVAALLVAREFPRCSVRGVDISEPMIKRATKRIGLDPDGRVSFRVADASALPFTDGSFDLVTQLNLPPFLDETARVLRPDGYFISATSWGERTPFYVDPTTLERTAARHGLQLVASGQVGNGIYSVFQPALHPPG